MAVDHFFKLPARQPSNINEMSKIDGKRPKP